LSVDPEYTILRMAYRRATLEAIKRVVSDTLSEKRLNALIGAMKSEGLIDVINMVTPEYENCVEYARTDKRVKDPEQYCLRRYPMRILTKLTEAGLIRLIELSYEHYRRFISPLLSCVEVAREFKNELGDNAVLVYDIDNETCVLATELINKELYLRVKGLPRWEAIPLVITYHRRKPRSSLI